MQEIKNVIKFNACVFVQIWYCPIGLTYQMHTDYTVKAHDH